MIYAIERKQSESPYCDITKTFLFESKELRDKVFNKIIEEAKNEEYLYDLEYNDEDISFVFGQCVYISKIELKVSTEENVNVIEVMFM